MHKHPSYPFTKRPYRNTLAERFRKLDVPLLVEWSDHRRETLRFVLEEESDARRFSVHRLAHYLPGPGRNGKDQPRGAGSHLPAPSRQAPQRLRLSGDRHTPDHRNPTRNSTVTYRASQRANPVGVVRANPHRRPSRRGFALSHSETLKNSVLALVYQCLV